MIYDDITPDDSMSVEAQVARAMGDDDWEALADQSSTWLAGRARAKTYEADRLTFDRSTRDE